MNDPYTHSLINSGPAAAVAAAAGEPSPVAPPETVPTAGRISFARNDDGSMSFAEGGRCATFGALSQAPLSPHPGGVPAHSARHADDGHAAAGQADDGGALLAALRARRHSLIVSFYCAGRQWYLLRMNQFRLNEVAIRAVALGNTPWHFGTAQVIADDNAEYNIAIAEPAGQASDALFRALVIATLQVGVVSGANDPTPFFNPHAAAMNDAFGRRLVTTEVEQFCEEPEAAEAVAMLFDRLTELNPDLWPEKKSVMTVVEANANLSTVKAQTRAYSSTGYGAPAPLRNASPPAWVACPPCAAPTRP